MRSLNLGIFAHFDAGKTSLTERLLHTVGVIEEIGSVDEGTTRTDSLELERRRGITIKAAVVSFPVGDLTVNLIDTPGHPDFIAEVERVLAVLDGAVLVVCAVERVQAQTRVLMRALERRPGSTSSNEPNAFQPDPLHAPDAFNGENAQGVLSGRTTATGSAPPGATTRGAGDKVVVIDSGIDPTHPEPRDNVLFVDNTIPCNSLTAIFGGGVGPLHDCSTSDTDGHGTWVASRMVGDDNGIGTNGIAPDGKVMGYKALATGYGGLTSWIVDAMLRACDNDADVINMSLGPPRRR